MHRGQNPGRAGFDSWRRYYERQRRPGQHLDQKIRSDSRQLHGLRCVRRADIGAGLHEDEEAKIYREERPALILKPAGLYVVQAFLAAER